MNDIYFAGVAMVSKTLFTNRLPKSQTGRGAKATSGWAAVASGPCSPALEPLGVCRGFSSAHLLMAAKAGSRYLPGG